MISVLSIIGTRPEAIKMAPVLSVLAKSSDQIKSIVCITGQHREMLSPVLSLFGIQPDFDLDVMQQNQTISHLTSRMLERIDPVIREISPTWILAQGDTTSVFVAALSAYYHRVNFGHIEAGLRTGDRYQPFPEEGNRLMVDALSELLFAPTERSRQALLHEGIAEEKIKMVGNTVIDALLATSERPYDWFAGPLAAIPVDKRLVLITAHRRENFGDPFLRLCEAVKELAITFRDSNVQFVYPVHLNPNVQLPVMNILSNVSGISLIPPLDYLSLVQLMKRCELILTDSGGIQEEAPTFKVPVLIMRETTERPEGVEAGVAKLVGTSKEKIIQEATHLLTDSEAHASMASAINPYGDGHSAERIVSILLNEGKL